MLRIKPILTSSTSSSLKSLSISIVNQWMGDLRHMPYGYHIEWKTPAEVEALRSADCKGKAVALYQRMQASGAKNVRLVIGKRVPGSRSTHAWLEWKTDGGTLVLDPTFNWSARRSESLSYRSYVPLYAFAGDKKYRATAPALYAGN